MRVGAFWCATVAAALAWAPPPDLWKFSHPEAALLAGIEWRRIAASGAGRMLEQQIVAAEAPGLAHLLAGAERILISAAPRAGKATGNSSRVLIAIEGSFDRRRLLELVSHRLPQRTCYRGIEILEEAGGGVALAFWFPETILLGDVASMRAAIDRAHGAGSGRERRLWERARELALASDVWLVADVPPAELAAEAPIPLDGIEGIEMSASFREDLEVGLHLRAASAGRAGELARTLESLGLLAATKLGAAGHSASAWEEFRVNVEGDRVGLAVRLKPDQLASAIAAATFGVAAGPQTAEAPRAGSAALGRRNVRIYGLEEGVREIPLGR
jgi:hypothetical protein